VMWANEVVAASDEAKGIYFNQPSVITLAPGRFVLQVIQSTGTGKQTNAKGGSKVHLYALQPTEAGPGVKGHFSSASLGSYQTHSALVAGGYGIDGTRRFGLLEAAITGNGVPMMSFIDYDPIAETFAPLDPAVNEWVLGPTIADSGFLSNLYGNNPNDQGRDYMRGIGDVPNPGAGTDKGFMPTVKDWFVLPYAGRNKGDYKNGLYLSFLPGATLEKLEPTTPEVVGGGKGTSNPNAEPDFGQPGDPKPTGTDPGEGNGGPGTGALQPGANSGCACSTPSRDEGGAAGALAALVGLSLLALRRRKES
jgi:MYXO-CTERM domain-containing protein